jgi:hypothetical protein
MGNNNKRHALSLLIAAGGCVAGAYSAYAAYSNGKLITDGIPGTMFGLAFAAVVIISWIMLPWADKRAEEGSHRDAWLWRASWFMALGFVLANSVLYTSHYRIEMAESKGLQIEAHERAKKIETLAADELKELRRNPRWDATTGCSDVTAAKSRHYCEKVRGAQARIQEAEAILGHGRPAAKDAGSETLAWVLGADEAKIRRSLPVFWAVILELLASLCMREAFASAKPRPAQRATHPMQHVAEGFKMATPFRGPVAVESPPLGIVTPANFEMSSFPLRGAMNDNMPIAVYA